MKKRMKDVLYVAVLFVMVLAPFGYISNVSAPVRFEETESESVIQWKEKQLEISIETEKESEETSSQYGDIRLYNVPLSAELQFHVMKECDGYNIAPAIVFAIMDEESDFNPSSVSGYGDIGIMQINPKWHEDRMERFNCTDLMDPYKNITVGIDYLAWLRDINPEVCWVIMAYNKGPDKATELLNQGIINDYALSVLERAKELEDEYGSNTGIIDCTEGSEECGESD